MLQRGGSENHTRDVKILSVSDREESLVAIILSQVGQPLKFPHLTR